MTLAYCRFYFSLSLQRTKVAKTIHKTTLDAVRIFLNKGLAF